MFTVKITSLTAQPLTKAGFRLVWRVMHRDKRGKPRWYYHATSGPYTSFDIAMEERSRYRLIGLNAHIIPQEKVPN